MDVQFSWSVPILARLNWPQLASVSVFMVSGLICFSNKWQLLAYLPELFLTALPPKEPEEALKNEFQIWHSVPTTLCWLVGWIREMEELSEEVARNSACKKRALLTISFPRWVTFKLWWGLPSCLAPTTGAGALLKSAGCMWDMFF